MKKTKKIAFICIAINIILLLQLCLSTVIALDENTAYTEPEQTVEEVFISEEVLEECFVLEQSEELLPMAAASTILCCLDYHPNMRSTEVSGTHTYLSNPTSSCKYRAQRYCPDCKYADEVWIQCWNFSHLF